MCGCLVICVSVSTRGFCDVWVCVCVGVMVICVPVFTVFCIDSFMCIYSYLFCLYWCKDYCHRVTTEL